MMETPQEIRIKSTSFKLNFSALEWNPQAESVVIALHGWLDNAASFIKMAPLISKDCRVIALDFLGHGHSDHLSPDGTYHMFSFVQQVYEFTRSLGLKSFHLLGHSMGGGVASLFAALFPELVLSLSLIEGLGPLSRRNADVPENVKEFILKSSKKNKSPSYASLEAAAMMRSKKSGITLEAALCLAERGAKKLDKKWIWRTDPRLLIPTVHMLTEEQVIEFIKRIQCPTLLILATNSLLSAYPQFSIRAQYLKKSTVKTILGNHHLHLENARPVSEVFNIFFKECSSKKKKQIRGFL